MFVLPAVGKIEPNCKCCGGTGVDPISCKRCCVCNDGESKYFYEFFWLEISGLVPNPYFKGGEGCKNGCSDLNGKHKLILRRYADFPDCPVLKTAHDSGLQWCLYTTDEPAPTQVSNNECTAERYGECMADTGNFLGCSPGGAVPRFALFCGSGLNYVTAPWGNCGGYGGPGLGISYPTGVQVEPYCWGVQGNNVTCEPTPTKECTLVRVIQAPPTGETAFYSQCLFGANLAGDDGKSPIGLPPLDGEWSAKLTPGGDKYDCDDKTKAFVMMTPTLAEPVKAPLSIRSVHCIHLGPRIEFRPGCSGWTCKHECMHPEHDYAVPGGVCQICPDYEPEQ